MAEQHTRPPDMSPTDLPQPSLVPAGRYSLLSSDDRYTLQGQLSTSAQRTDQTRPSIETLLHGVWQQPRPTDIVQDLFENRLRAQTLELGDVLEQIKERVAIYRQHFESLEQAKLDVINVRHLWADPIRRHGTLTDPDLVNAIQDIDAQQRQERLSCWKDLSSLRQQVPEHWRHYLAAVHQYQILGSQGRGEEK